MPGSFNNITLSATVAEGGNLTVTITPSSALSAATTVRWTATLVMGSTALTIAAIGVLFTQIA